MLRSIFLKEMKSTAKSITYLVFVGILILFTYTQLYSEFKKIEKPQQNQKSYGVKYQEIPEIIMPGAVSSLYSEFTSNSYIAYPIGFYKNVKLNDKKQTEMAEILSKLTGISKDEFIKSTGADKKGQKIYIDSSQMGNTTKQIDGSYQLTIPDRDANAAVKEPSIKDLKVDGNLTYQQFLDLMKQADKLIGGGSKYSDTYLIQLGAVPKTYEEALLDYNDIVKRDSVIGAYARLFCDYAGIVLAIFPVFIAVASGLKDRRARIQELIFVRKMSSVKISAARFMAMIAVMFLPVLVLAFYFTIQVSGYYPGYNIDYFAFIKYSLFWLLPTLMVSTAVGVLVTELTDTPIAIAFQGIWWFLGLFAGLKHINGGYGADLMLRHNILGNTSVYFDNINTLVINRLCYAFIALILIGISVWIFEQKRRGRFNVYTGIKKILIHS